MTHTRRRVIACGNPLMGNDGAGIAVLHLLLELNPGIDAVDGGAGGLGLIPLMEGYEKIVIVDAMVGIGERIGEVHIFREPPPVRHGSIVLHDLGVGEAVTVARELGLATKIVTIGIEVGSVDHYSPAIDPAVEDGVKTAYAFVLREMAE